MKKFETAEVNLAFELAEQLKDEKSLAQYLIMVRKYKASFLNNVLAEVLRTPQKKIRKSRGALFTYLIKKYGDKNSSWS